MSTEYCYNVNIAKKLGVSGAILISILYMNERFCKSDLIIDRNDIFELTGLRLDTQQKIEEYLISKQILNIKPFRGNNYKYHYSINIDTLNNVLDNTLNIQEVPINTIKLQKVNKVTKKSKHINMIKESIYKNNELSDIIKQYTCDWVDAVYSNPRGFLTTQSVKINMQELDNFTKDTDIKLDILKIAIKGGFRDISWAIDQYQKSNKKNNFVSYNDIKSDGSTSTDEVF